MKTRRRLFTAYIIATDVTAKINAVNTYNKYYMDDNTEGTITVVANDYVFNDENSYVDKKYTDRVKALSAAAESAVLKKYQVAYLNAQLEEIDWSNVVWDDQGSEATNTIVRNNSANANVLNTLEKLGLSESDIDEILKTNVGAAEPNYAVFNTGNLSEDAHKDVSVSGSYKIGNTGDTLSVAQDKAVTTTTDKLKEVKNKYDATYAGYDLLEKSGALTAANNDVKSATTDKERADTKVTKAEKALTVAEEKVEEAIAARDEAYAEAELSGNAELVARDKAQEEKLAEAYEQELAVQANYEAKVAYDQADTNYDKAADLDPNYN